MATIQLNAERANRVVGRINRNHPGLGLRASVSSDGVSVKQDVEEDGTRGERDVSPTFDTIPELLHWLDGFEEGLERNRWHPARPKKLARWADMLHKMEGLSGYRALYAAEIVRREILEAAGQYPEPREGPHIGSPIAWCCTCQDWTRDDPHVCREA